MNIEDLLSELEGSDKTEVQEPVKKEAPPEDYGPVLRTLPARSRNIVCGICRKKLKPSEKYWCQSTDTASYWWCCSCLK